MLFVVTSGRPAGELFDRSVHLVQADTALAARMMCEIDNGNYTDWVYGPNIYPKRGLSGLSSLLCFTLLSR